MGLVYNYQPANRTCFPSHVLSVIVEIISVFDRPKFCILLFFISEHHYGVVDIQPACSHCIPQLANHAAFVISTILDRQRFLSLTLSSFLSHLDWEIALEGWRETAICQGHRLHCAICHRVRLREFGRLALFWLSQLNPRFSTMLLTHCTWWRWC